MRKLFAAMFVALFMVGCGGGRQVQQRFTIPPFQQNAHLLKSGMTKTEVYNLLGHPQSYPRSTRPLIEAGLYVFIYSSVHDSPPLTRDVAYHWHALRGGRTTIDLTCSLMVKFESGRLVSAYLGGSHLNGLHSPRTALPGVDTHTIAIVKFPNAP